MPVPIHIHGIILGRIAYAEADRILTVLSVELGKISIIAKGVRRGNSRLAGGIELLSEAELDIVKGRGELYTLTGSRMIRHYGEIIKNLPSTEAAYKLIEFTRQSCDDGAGEDLYDLLIEGLRGLDEGIPPDTVSVWFLVRLMRSLGNAIELFEDNKGEKLKPESHYNFSYEDMKFFPYEQGAFTADHIKVLRLSAISSLRVISKVKNVEAITQDLNVVITQAFRYQQG